MPDLQSRTGTPRQEPAAAGTVALGRVPATAAAFSLQGRVCLVTGAGSGIGQAVAEVLARQGARVGVNDIDARAARRTTGRLAAAAAPVALAGDVTRPEEATRVVERAVAVYGRLDVLVNNAAAHVPVRDFRDTTPDQWPASLSSLHATLACTHAAIPVMVGAGHGRVVNVTSVSGAFGVPGMAVYGAAKGAVHALTATLAKELAPHGVTVNCVAPGVVDTPRQRGRDPELRARRRAQVPLGRFATGEEVAYAVAFLASDEASYITGETLFVDGGRP